MSHLSRALESDVQCLLLCELYCFNFSHIIKTICLCSELIKNNMKYSVCPHLKLQNQYSFHDSLSGKPSLYGFNA